MTKQRWRSISLVLGAVLIGLLMWIGAAPLSGRLLAQITSVNQCGISRTEWAFGAVQSLTERYGILLDTACGKKGWRGNHPEVRADIAGWFAPALDQFNESTAAATADSIKKSDLESLNRLYAEVLAQVEALEQRPSR